MRNPYGHFGYVTDPVPVDTNGPALCDSARRQRKGYGYRYKAPRQCGTKKERSRFAEKREKKWYVGGMADQRYDGKRQIAAHRALRTARAAS